MSERAASRVAWPERQRPSQGPPTKGHRRQARCSYPRALTVQLTTIPPPPPPFPPAPSPPSRSPLSTHQKRHVHAGLVGPKLLLPPPLGLPLSTWDGRPIPHLPCYRPRRAEARATDAKRCVGLSGGGKGSGTATSAAAARARLAKGQGGQEPPVAEPVRVAQGRHEWVFARLWPSRWRRHRCPRGGLHRPSRHRPLVVQQTP